MALTVLDASVVIAFRDPADALHSRAIAAFRVRASEDFVLPASVYAEVLVGPIRTGVAAVRSLEQFVQEFAMQIEPLTPAVARRAAELRASTTSLRLPDAFVLATADVLRATTILTADKKWVGLSPRVQLL